MSVVLLDNLDHHDLRVLPRAVAAGADGLNQVLVFPTELEAAARDFPILFRRWDDGVRALAVLGLDAGENLFLDGGRWTARHLPALVARGPFSIGLQPRDDGTREPMIHVDLAHPAIGRDGGEPLFLPQGGNARYLERVADVLRLIHAGHEAQAPMAAAFEAAGLLRPVTLELMLDDTRRYDLLDFMAVDAGALAALPGDALAELNRQGFLALAFAAAGSLDHFGHLLALKREREARG